MQYSRPDTYNAVRDLARHMTKATQVHYDAMLRMMKYANDTSDRGLVLNPTRKWDGNKEHEFIISGRSDSNYAKDTQTRKSISGYRVLLEGAPVMFKSSTQKFVALSVCEAEHQKQHHVPYSLAILINGICLLIHGIASTLWAFHYVFSST